MLIGLSVNLFGQIDFTKFPRIGFGDFSAGSADDKYNLQYELGYNYIVSNQAYGIPAYNNKNTSTNSIKVMLDLGGNTIPWCYCWSGVNDDLNLPYEVGGPLAYIANNQADNFGFGTSSQTSWWAGNYFSPPTIMIGSRTFTDGNRTVFAARKGIDSAGYLLFGKIYNGHTWTATVNNSNYNYTLNIVARSGTFDDFIVPSDAIATIKIWQASAVDTDTTGRVSYIIRGSDLGTHYKSISIPNIIKTDANRQIEFSIYWHGKCDLYIDQYSIYDPYYKGLFLSDAAGTNSAISSIVNELRNYHNVNNPAFAHFYLDEPAPMYFKSVARVSAIADSILPGKYINGAVSNMYREYLNLALSRRSNIPYIMVDNYPFSADIDSSTEVVQPVLDNLICTQETTGYGTGTKGYRVIIERANNNTQNITSDDIPFISVIQVQKEVKLSSEYLRAPTNNEIKVQGWLSICYGARGLGYYSTTTQKFPSGGSDTTFCHGLIDYSIGSSDGKYFDTSSTVVLSPRFDAVKQLNQKISLIENDLVQLTWMNAYSIHKGQPTGTYVTNVSSGDASASTYVELGLFKKTSDFTNSNLDYFMVVNRRTLSAESRNIAVTINKSSSYSNWKITEVGTANSWIVAYNGSFTASYTPGEGKLFKLEPMFVNTNETLSGNITACTNITVPSSKKLIFNTGSIVSFANSLQLVVTGLIEATGTTFHGFNNTSWYGITISGPATSYFTNCTIKDCQYGIIANASSYNSSPYVTGCSLSASVAGIWIKNYGDPQISNSYISSSGTAAVLATNNARGAITRSKLFGTCLYGHKNDNSATTWYGYYNNARNIIYGTNFPGDGYSIYVTGGYPVFNNGNNSIPARGGFSQYYNATGASLNAAGNYWGGSIPYITGSVTYTPYLTSLPSPLGPDWTLSKTTSEDGAISSDDPLILAWTAFEDNNFSKAIEYAKIVFNNNINTRSADNKMQAEALFLWMKAAMLNGDLLKSESILKSLNSSTQYTKSANYEAVRWLAKTAVIKDNIKLAEEYILSIPVESPYCKEILFDAAVETIERWNNLEKAQCFFDRLAELYPDKETTKEITLVKNLYGEYLNVAVDKEGIKYIESKVSEIPVSMNMLEAYPNPFNPTTNIAYSLTETGKVNIKVYDILGREITTLVDDIKEPGYYTTSFNALNLASGIYFARITISTNNNKAPYIKTIKMILTK
jgi:tetratricopeptide (TPR) repeat protein